MQSYINVIRQYLFIFNFNKKLIPTLTVKNNLINNRQIQVCIHSSAACIQDVRINDGYFAMTDKEADDPDTMAIVEENQNTRAGCKRDDCGQSNCGDKATCFPLWGKHECR